ncbi:MAG: TGS domain-containing protein, partial [Myxococcales bacterium]
MAEIDIALPDGSHKQVPAGTTVADFIQTHIGKGLARAALYAQLDG